MGEKRNDGVFILMADDDEDDCLLIGLACEGNPVIANLRFVYNGEELLDYLDACRERGPRDDLRLPDLILLDLNMPKKDGRVVLRQIKENAHYRSIGIVIFTTSSREEDMAICNSLGADLFLTKPHTLDGFKDVINTLVRRWSEIRETPSER